MSVPSWRQRPETPANDSRGKSRKRRVHPGRAIVEQLETRQLLTFSASLAGSTATFTVGNTTDAITFSQSGGLLDHGPLTAPAGQTFASDFDFDSSVPGVQTLPAAADSSVVVQGPAYSATLGTPTAPASTLLASFDIAGNLLGVTSGSSLAIDDSGSVTSNTYTVTPLSIAGTGINVSIGGVFSGNGVELTTGSGTNTVNVQSAPQYFSLSNPAGTDTVNIDGLTPLNLTEGSGATSLVTIDDSTDTSPRNFEIQAKSATEASFFDTNPYSPVFEPIGLPIGPNDSLTILGGPGQAQTGNSLTLDFSAGNPVSKLLNYHGGGGYNSLTLQGSMPGGPFSDETYDATGPGNGSISLDSSRIDFSGLKPIVDSTPATSFTFNDTTGTVGQINVVRSSLAPSSTFISSSTTPPQFESINYANKANARINTGPGDDVVSFDPLDTSNAPNLPPTTIDGQGGLNTLNYNADALPIVVSPTGTPGQATITRSGAGTLTAQNFQRINIVDGQIQGVPVPSLTFTPTTIAATSGVALTNAVVAKFTSSDLNATAASFGSTISWGDGTKSAGTIVPDASDPTVFYVEGSHTFASSAFLASVGVTVSQTVTDTSTVPGVTITEFAASSTTSTANIADASLSAQGATLAGVAGETLTRALVASFADDTTEQLASPNFFSGTISWGDGSTSPFNGSNITSVGTSPNGVAFQVKADHTYATFGTFPVSVTINSEGGSSAVAQGLAIVTDAPITLTPAQNITLTEGTSAGIIVATLTDSNPSATASDFLATINWGDGQASEGFVSAQGGPFPDMYFIGATHTYTRAGSYSATVSVRDTGLTGGSTASVVVPVTVGGATLTPAFGAVINTETAKVPFTSAVGSFNSANPFASATDFTASVNWGDGTPATPGTITEGADGQFTVAGSHTYNVPSLANHPYVVSVSVLQNGEPTPGTFVGGSTDVLDAALTVQGATVSAVEGSPLARALVASFTYAGGAVATSNFGGTVNWGDGTTSTLSAANFTLVPAASSGVATYVVNAGHTFPSQGTFPISVTVNSGFGSSAVASATAVVSDSLTVNVLPISTTQGVPFTNGVVATFKDAGIPDPASKYSATINWGDGTPIVPGTIVANADGTFSVLGSHAFAGPGSLPVSVTVSNDLSGETTGTGIASVNPAPLNLVGYLNRASDSGVSNTDAITNDRTPNFFGSAAPGTIVRLYAIPVGTNIPVPIGQGVTNAAGAWSITSIAMADGRYAIQAIGTDPAGVTAALDVVLPNPLQGPLVVDTVAPKVEGVLFQPLTGQVKVTFQDNSSGLDQGQVINGANYTFTRVATLPGQSKLKGVKLPSADGYVVTGLSTSPQTVPTDPQTVEVSIDGNRPIRGGFYLFTIRSGGIEDVAGNALDGEFYGYFPSGNNLPGGNFIADLDSVHNTVLPPLAVGSTSSPLTPPGTLPTTTFIPTVNARGTAAKSGKFSLAVNNNQALVPIAGETSTGKLQLQAAKVKPVVGKATPHVIAAKPHIAATKAPKSNA